MTQETSICDIFFIGLSGIFVGFFRLSWDLMRVFMGLSLVEFNVFYGV